MSLELRVMLSVLLLMFLFFCSFWAYDIALKKGENKLKWAVLAFVFNIWALLFLIKKKEKNV